MGSSFRLVVVALAALAIAACSKETPVETVRPKKAPPRLNVITLKISPADAVVKVDGKLFPKRKLLLPPSQKGYLIQVTAKYCRPYETRVSALSNMSLRVDLEVNPMAAATGAKDDPKTLTPLARSRRAAFLPVRRAGLVRTLGTGGKEGKIASIFGRDSRLGTDADNALGGLIGSKAGEAYGVGGLGLLGSGSGGGGFGPQRVNAGTPTVKGPLARGVVSRRLNSKLSAVRACLRAPLSKHSKLEGVVVLQLIIDGKGKVRLPRVKRSTLKKLKVGKCLVAALKKCTFPAPRNRRKVLVTWPLKVSKAATIGLGTLGTIGKGGRRGAGYGRGRSSKTRVVAGRAKVAGALDRGIIRRIIRRHINEVRYCYQKQLVKKPKLAGRVTVAFTISPSGQVSHASIRSTTLKHKKAEACITRAVKRWLFPKPRGGGVVRVIYPFVLRTTR